MNAVLGLVKLVLEYFVYLVVVLAAVDGLRKNDICRVIWYSAFFIGLSVQFSFM